jgi:TonB family protein
MLDVIPIGEQHEMQIMTWQASAVTCGAGSTIAPVHISLPHPEMLAVRIWNGPPQATLTFALDAEGRPFGITGDPAERSRLQMRDLMPALRASRFATDAPQTGCTIRYTPELRSMSDAPLETLARFGVAQRLRMGKDAWERLAPGDCRNSPRLAPLTRSYPDFRKLERREGERQWTYVRYDIDADGVPVNLAIGENSGYAALDEEALRAVAAGRYAGGPRTGCIQSWWTGSATIPAPPPPPKPETEGNPACEIKDRWEKEPRLVFPSNYQQRAIEGWAILQYDVAPWGQIGAIKVLAAEPSTEFGDAARNVLSSAKFKPRESGLSGCIDRVFFRIRKDDPVLTDGSEEAGSG